MKKAINLIILTFALFSCSLDVDNENDPDVQQAYSDPNEVKNLAISAYQAYWSSTHSVTLYSGSLLAADQFTGSWAVPGWYDLSKEPRIEFNNQISYENANITNNLYFGLTIALSSYVNRVIWLIQHGTQIGEGGKENAGILALCYFMQGAILGQLGLTYDQTMIIKENTDVNTVKFSKYSEVIKASVQSLEKSISICDTSKFKLDRGIVPGTILTENNLKQVCHSYIARFMVLSPRNKSDNDTVNWEKVLENAQLGITTDFGPIGDALGTKGGKFFDKDFYDLNTPLNNLYVYAFVDCRLMHLMDKKYPVRYPDNGVPPDVHAGLKKGEAQSADQRLSTDFKYYPSCGMWANRGYYNFSHYQFIRYDYMTTGEGIGQLFDMRQYENELLKAEAYVMKVNPENSAAVAILNDENNPRIDRGKLPKLNDKANKKDILDAIFYEREIELLAQGFMVGFCDMRRRDLLQRGTPLQYPVPGKELETLQIDYYTFGGQDKADGVNASNGGWETIKDY
jgi:starch-binding outer membrane protein, SusD/RagB family